jgi:hypothetical protein
MDENSDVLAEMDISQEMDLVKMMISIADKEDLTPEVVYSFATALRDSSASIEECVNYALSDWDLI